MRVGAFERARARELGILDRVLTDAENAIYDAGMAAAYARASEVARSVKRRVPYDQNKHPCTTTMEQIASAILALGEAKG